PLVARELDDHQAEPQIEEHPEAEDAPERVVKALLLAGEKTADEDERHRSGQYGPRAAEHAVNQRPRDAEPRRQPHYQSREARGRGLLFEGQARKVGDVSLPLTAKQGCRWTVWKHP